MTKYELPAHRLIFDYMQLYEICDTSIKVKESSSLDFVSSKLVGVEKIKYNGSLQKLYEDDFETFMYYNAVDSVLVQKIHEARNYISIISAISSLAQIRIVDVVSQMNNALGSLAITEGVLRNRFRNMDNIVLFRDEKGDVLLYDLLNKMCEGINNSLGNMNKLSVAIDDEDNNRVYFLDEVKLPNRDNIISKILPELETKVTTFQVYGYLPPPEGSGFIKSMGVETEITNDLATMISVGAQASGGNVKGTDGTAFSKWNEGLIDRIIPVKSGEKTTTENSTTSPSLILE